MKRKLSLLMVLMMVLTLIPAMPSFAGSGDISVSGRTDLVIGRTTDASNPPTIYFDNTPRVAGQPNTRPIATTTSFTVVLDGGNADFLTNYPVPTLPQPGVTYTSNGYRSLDVTVDPNVAGTSFYVPLHFRAIANGQVKVRLDRLSGFNPIPNEGLVATIQSQQSTIIVDRVGNIARNNSIIETRSSESRVRISENTIGAWNGAEPIEIRLDDSKFSFGSNIMFTMGGHKFSMTQGSITSGTRTPIYDAATGGTLIGYIDSTPGSGSVTTYAEILDSGRTLKIYPDALRRATFTPNGGTATNLYTVSSRNEISIDLPIRVAKDAQVGKDVTATMRGQISPTSITLAKYTDYTVEAKAEKVLDVIAGQDVPGRYKSIVNLEEMVSGSLLDGRVLEVSLVGVDKDGKEIEEVAAFQYGEVVKIQKLKGTGDLNIVAQDLEFGATSTPKKTALVDLRKLVDGKNTGDYIIHDSMEVEVNRGSNNASTGTNNPSLLNPVADKWEFQVPFVVATDYKGELFLKFNGAGVDNLKVKIADVKAPVTFEVGKESGKLADLNIGQQHQVAPEVTIKETVAGALLERDVVRGFDNKYGLVAPSKKNSIYQWGSIFTSGKVEVKEGNAKIKDTNTDSLVRDFWLDNRSTSASTLLISDVKVTLDRTVPYGEFKISVDAGNVNARHDLTDKIDTVAYFNVVTPHPEDKNVLTVFTIGEASYKQTISGVEKNVELDVAPQIMNNRTMMPIRYVADALGAKVNYDTTTRTAIFSKDAITVSMTLDTNIMYVNGSPVVMETAPVVQADRALVSLVNIAQAFGLNSVSAPATGDIVWDASAKTVTLFPSAQ